MNSRYSRWLLVIFALGLMTQAGAAQLYRWVDSKGNVEWRDTPPPASVPQKQIEQRRVGGSVVGGTSGSPFAVQLAAKNHPVTFWSSSDCGKTCDSARAHLAKRGIPYTETSPNADLEGFKKVSPRNEIPVLQVGKTTLKGYLDSEWDGALDNAGYPRSAPAVKPTVIQPKASPEAAPQSASAGAPAAAPAPTQGDKAAAPAPPPPAPVTVPVIR